MKKQQLTVSELFLVASTLFGLFFGAGNIIFPVSMGQMAGANMWLAGLGFVLTAIGLPLLGVAAMGVSHSDGVQDMSRHVSKGYSYFFTLALYLTIGPFFAIPRTASVSFEVGLANFMSETHLGFGLWIYSFIFFGLALILALKPGKILDYVGKYLNPAFLIMLAIIFIVAFISPLSAVKDVTPTGEYASAPIFGGLLAGYDTMDALASLAFGIIVVQSVRQLGVDEPKRIGMETVKSGLFALLAMALIYFCLTLLGAQSRGGFAIAENGGIAISQITTHYFGAFGTVLLAIIMFIACLKTAVGLIVACAETFESLSQHKISVKTWTIVSTVIAFLAANIGLNNIIAYSQPVLMLLYPLAIVLILLALFDSYIKDKRLYKWVTVFTFVPAIFDFVKSLPEPVYSWLGGNGWVAVGETIFPFFTYGFGWILPAIIGLIVGLFMTKQK
ncbi:MAG: branched-chain amino acid transport system II carrier protein [Aerococcus suis]|nr:branched-chain amino acid transport system II carrier protein [Aerococcus suis]